MKIILTSICISVLTLPCEPDRIEKKITTIEISLTPGQIYYYDTGLTGDEEGASILVPPKNAQISEMIKNASTNYSAVYKYQPQSNFIGTDFVELQLSKGSNGASSGIKESIILVYNISKPAFIKDSVVIKYGKCTNVLESLTLCFDELISDSRCPEDVVCFWAGDAHVRLRKQINDIESYLELHTFPSFTNDTTVDNYHFTLNAVKPNPNTQIQHSLSDYEVSVTVIDLKNVKPNARVLDFNPNKAICQWGWTIALDGDTIKSDDQSFSRKVGYNFDEPIDVYLELGEHKRSCSPYDYYEIENLYKVD